MRAPHTARGSFVAKNGTFLMARFVPEMAHCAHFAISGSFSTVSLYRDWSAHFAISGSFSTAHFAPTRSGWLAD